MGRKAGVSAEQTRSELLAAAARVFALKGYDGASIADITSEAALSSGSIYAHYGGKAELFVAAVQEHAQAELADLIGLASVSDLNELSDLGSGVVDFVERAGTSFVRTPGDSALLIEAVVAARRHPDVAELVASWLGKSESLFDFALRQAQASEVVDPSISAAAVGRFVSMLALGARLTSALNLPPIDEDEWSDLIARLVDTLRGPDGAVS